VALARKPSQITNQRGIAEALRRVSERISPHLWGHDSTIVHSTNTSVRTRLQAIFTDRPFSSQLDRSLHEIIMEHAVAAEKMGPGGFDACLRLIIHDIDKIGLAPYKRDASHLLKRIESSGGRRPNERDIEQLIEFSAEGADSIIRQMINRAVRTAGFGGRIIVERSLGTVPSIELMSGYTFQLDPAWSISALIDEPRIAVIDGFVESVGEINSFLEGAHSLREPACIFARGFAPDVISTLRVNFDRGTLRVIPIVVRFDAEGINVLKDVAIVAGCDVTSSTKGDLISSLTIATCPRIKQAMLGGGRIVLTSTSTKAAVDQHVEILRARRTQQHDALGNLIDSRIRSLSPNHVILRLLDDRDFVKNAQSVDRALRIVAAAVDRGVVDDHNLAGLPRTAPVGTIVGTIMHAELCIDRLQSIGAAVTSD
jgi:chaperonin GroEL (HSP60 family)